METATRVAAALPQFCPTTNHYRCSDGRWLLVTDPQMDTEGTLSAFGIHVPISKVQLPVEVDVFLSDDAQNVLDADGDPSNGMTPLGSFAVRGHAAALAELGYEEVVESDG